MFVVLVIRRNRFLDLIMIEQVGAGSCILGQDKINILQYFQCTKCNVFEITNGSGNQV
jgi:hypothetical protein